MGHRRRLARSFLVLLVVATLCTPSAWGTPLRLSLELHPLEALASLWDAFAALWAQSGCGIDPFGGCMPPPSTDSGCGIDPHGGCTDSGLIVDPHG
jgi:hypothetical protein